MKHPLPVLFVLLTIGLLGGSPLSGAPVIVNGDFGDGLVGWTAVESGGNGAAGEVSASEAGATLGEGDSFLVTLSQSFVMPENPETLSFNVTPAPGFKLTDSFHPDAFEASLLTTGDIPIVPPWKPQATSFFNMQEDGAIHLGDRTLFNGTTVTLDISDLAPGTLATIYFDLIGGDGDTGSGVTISNVVLVGGNEPPELAPVGDQTVDEGTTTDVAILASDPDEDPITLTVTGLPPFASFLDNGDGTGTITIAPTFDDAGEYPGIEITAADAEESVSETITIIVNNVNRPPVCDAADVETIECPGAVTTVSLDGTASSDPDGDSLTYLWEADCAEGTFDDPTSATPTFSVDTSCGCTVVCTVTLTVDDGTDTDSCTTEVRIEDTTPPVVTCSLGVDVLWSPDHKLVDVGLEVSVSDDCAQSIAEQSLVIEVWSDETEVPDTGDGTGRHAPDAKDIATGLRLRKERRGTEDGRVYLIAARAEDGSGNVTFAFCAVSVPHDQSGDGLDEVAAQVDAALATVAAAPGSTIAEKVAPLGFIQHGLSEELGPNQ